eukprot:gene4924-8711_t
MGAQESLPTAVHEAKSLLSERDIQLLHEKFQAISHQAPAAKQREIPIDIISGWISQNSSQNASSILNAWRKGFDLIQPQGITGMDQTLFDLIVSIATRGTRLQRAKLFAYMLIAISTDASSSCIPCELSESQIFPVLEMILNSVINPSTSLEIHPTERLVHFLNKSMFGTHHTLTFDSLTRKCSSNLLLLHVCDELLRPFTIPNSSMSMFPPIVQNTFLSGRRLLDVQDFIAINEQLPPKLQHEWSLLFSTQDNGRSEAVSNVSASVIVFKDTDDYVFGGFASLPWAPSPDFFGTDESFLFSLKPSLNFFPSTGSNANYQYFNVHSHSKPNGLGFGGILEYFGVFVDSDLAKGHCRGFPCSTYGNNQLSAKEEFCIESVEVWCVGQKPQNTSSNPRRKRSSILEQSQEDQNLLELHGRKMHSRDIREAITEED